LVFLIVATIDVFAHEVCDGSQETKMRGGYFYLGACTQEKYMPHIL